MASRIICRRHARCRACPRGLCWQGISSTCRPDYGCRRKAIKRRCKHDCANPISSGKELQRNLKKAPHKKFNMELCAGSAGYSAKIFKFGMLPLAVDHGGYRHRQQFPCVTLDLTQRSSHDILEKLISERRVFSIRAAPPCGTASRARRK